MDNYKRFSVGNTRIFTEVIDDKPTHVSSRKLQVDKSKPVSKIHIDEATSKGLTLLFRSNSRVYGYYELGCGHKTFLHYGAVRKMRGNPKCEPCMVETLKSRAGRVGLTFLSRINTSLDTGIYSCNKCNNHMLLKHANIALSSENNYSCKKCSELRLEDLVKNIGAIWLTKGRPYNEDSEFILKCGHRKNMRLSSINSWCPVCHNEKLSAEAIEQGIEFLPEIKPSKIDNKVYKLKCGCIKNLSPPRVKEGAFECKIHDKRILDFSRNGYVYLVELKLPDITVLKVGFTLDVSGKGCRYVRYGVSKECVKPIREIKFDDGNFAYDSERLIHRKYKHLRVDSSILRNNLKNGFTECYPIELKDTLIEELERLNV